MTKNLVSAIVTTRNNQSTIKACLESIINQSYSQVELILVDNGSTDATPDIARQYTSQVYVKGPERSAQRNFAAAKANGQYVFIIDSDMELNRNVIADCVKTAQQTSARAVIIPEESFGKGFWAQCKRLERSYYIGNDGIEAARFFDKNLYRQLGGYNETLTGGEDWDLTDRMRQHTKIIRVKSFIYHNEGHIKLPSALKKRFYYNKGFLRYYRQNTAQPRTNGKAGGNVLRYYKLYMSKPGRLLKKPHYGLGMLFMKTCEFGTGGLSILAAKFTKETS